MTYYMLFYVPDRETFLRYMHYFEGVHLVKRKIFDFGWNDFYPIFYISLKKQIKGLVYSIQNQLPMPYTWRLLKVTHNNKRVLLMKGELKMFEKILYNFEIGNIGQVGFAVQLFGRYPFYLNKEYLEYPIYDPYQYLSFTDYNYDFDIKHETRPSVRPELELGTLNQYMKIQYIKQGDVNLEVVGKPEIKYRVLVWKDDIEQAKKERGELAKAKHFNIERTITTAYDDEKPDMVIMDNPCLGWCLFSSPFFKWKDRNREISS